MRKVVSGKALCLLLFLMWMSVMGCVRFGQERASHNALSERKAWADSSLLSCASYFSAGQSVQLHKCLSKMAPCMEQFRQGGTEERALYMRYLRSQLTYYAQFTNQYDSMLYYAQGTKQMALDLGDNRAAINAMSNLGDILRQKGDEVGAAQEYLNAMLLNDSTVQEPELYLAIHSGLGCTYIVLRNLDKAEQILQGMKRWKESMQRVDSISYFQLLGNCYYYMKDYTRSLSCFKALDSLLATHPEMEFDHHICQVNVADILIQKKEDERLGDRLQASASYFLANGINAYLPYIHTLEIQHLLNRGRTEEALACAQRTQDDLQQMNPDHKVARYTTLARCMKAVGAYEKALQYEEMEQTLADSLRNQQTHAMVDEMEQRYDHNLMRLRQENEMQRHRLWTMGLWVALALVSLLCVALTFTLVLWHKKVSIEREMSVNKILSLRHQVIHNRITPHFISNALSLGEKLSQEDIASIIYLIKDALAQEYKPSVELYEEMELVNAYVNVARRISCRCIDFQVDDIDVSLLRKVMVPSMSLLILVENAIKHGAVGEDGCLHISLSVASSPKDVWLRLKNGGSLGQYGKCNDTAMHGLRMLNDAIALTNSNLAQQSISFEMHDTHDGCVECLMHIIYNNYRRVS